MLCYLEVDTFQFFRTSPTKNTDKKNRNCTQWSVL